MSKIIEQKVETFILNEQCEKCNIGNIVRDPNQKITLATFPPRVPVKCTNEKCDYTSLRYEHDLYPKFKYEIIKE